jgi:hypothetical protein
MNNKRKMAILLVACSNLLTLPTLVYAAQSTVARTEGRIWDAGIAPMAVVIILLVAAVVLVVAVTIFAVIAHKNYRRICRNKFCELNPDCEAGKPYEFDKLETPDEINATRQFRTVRSGEQQSGAVVVPAPTISKAPIIDPVDIMLQQVIARLEQEALRAPVPLQLVPQMKHARKPQPLTEVRKAG